MIFEAVILKEKPKQYSIFLVLGISGRLEGAPDLSDSYQLDYVYGSLQPVPLTFL